MPAARTAWRKEALNEIWPRWSMAAVRSLLMEHCVLKNLLANGAGHARSRSQAGFVLGYI
jgi:hypothetical protein